MIQEVFISGQLGKAIYIVGGHRMLLRAEDSEPHLCTAHDISLFFQSGAEYSLLERSFGSLAEIKPTLDLDTRCHDALRLVLGALDPDLSMRHESSILAAEELLQDSAVRTFIIRRLRSRPLPALAQIADARDLAARTATVALLDDVQASQPHIIALLGAWEVTKIGFLVLMRRRQTLK
jgi:hypothetical protein